MPPKRMDKDIRKVARHSLPPILQSHRVSIDRFLRKMLDGHNLNLAGHKELLRDSPDDRVRGIVAVLEAQRSCLLNLLSINQSRRGYVETD